MTEYKDRVSGLIAELNEQIEELKDKNPAQVRKLKAQKAAFEQRLK